MPWLVQDAIVTSIAAGALVLLVRRIAGVVRPDGRPPACGSCASAPTCGPSSPPADASAAIPLTLIRGRRGTSATSTAGRQDVRFDG